MNFKDNLIALRKMKNFSQEDLAEKLDVSRQAVSKWESGTGYPETEKIIAICDIFGCSMDDLIKGHITTDEDSERQKYESFMNKYSKSIAFAIMLILIGVTIMLIMMGIDESNVMLGTTVLLIFVVFATPILVLRGIERDNFKRKHPTMPNIYTNDEIDSYNELYSRRIALAIGIILAGVVCFLGSYAIFKNAESSVFPTAILVAFITVAVPILIEAGIQKDKYNIEMYNKENSVECKEENDKVGKYCGIIMIMTTIIYLLISFVFNLWEITWLIYPIGGMICGIVTLIVKKDLN